MRSMRVVMVIVDCGVEGDVMRGNIASTVETEMAATVADDWGEVMAAGLRLLVCDGCLGFIFVEAESGMLL